MKALLSSARIAPKKANLVAKMVRGMKVQDAIDALQHTHKKGARMIEKLLLSALANAQHNDKQSGSLLMIKTIVVNQGTSYRRAIPKARGSVRPIRKFLSHIEVTLGIAETEEKKSKKSKSSTKSTSAASQKGKNTVKKTGSPKESSDSSTSSIPSTSTDSSVSAS